MQAAEMSSDRVLENSLQYNNSIIYNQRKLPIILGWLKLIIVAHILNY